MGGFKDTLYSFFSPFGGSSEEHEYYQRTTRPPSKPRTVQDQGTINILVLGRSGSGKTTLINAVCYPDPSGIARRHESTTKTLSHRTRLFEKKYRLIDTPGFDNVGLSDVEVCTKIGEYFWDEGRRHLGVNGIIYIHQAGDPLRSRSLRRYLAVLSRVLLTSVGMPRLTIFIPHSESQPMIDALIDEELRDNNSLLTEASAMRARIFSGGIGVFTNILEDYRATTPILLPIQDYNPNLTSEIESLLYERPRQPPPSNQEARLKASQQKLDELHSTLDAKEHQLTKYRNECHQLRDLQAGQQDTEARLRRELQQTQREYATLRSELQLQENYEQSEIVQELEDLNRQIEDISRGISAYLVDNHARTAFGKELTDVTALEAQNLPELLKLLGYDAGKCSLVSSGKGDGLDIEGFLDFTIRDLLCGLLSEGIFDPFHPAIDSEQSDALWRAYEDIQKRESQTKSGKWRSLTFKSIYKDDNPDQVATWINELLHRFIRKYLSPLLKCVFGTKDATMDRQYYNQMHELVKRAWDWNAKLKGGVVVLGDFRLTVYTTFTEFDPDAMEDFESRPHRKPTSVLGMAGLGLVSLRAVGGGQPPEETLVCKAIVTTDTLYA